MKRTLIRLACMLLALTLPLTAWAESADPAPGAEAPAAEAAAQAPEIEKKTYPYLYSYDKDKEPVESRMNLYFLNGTDVPYAALSEFMPHMAEMAKERGEWDLSYEIQSAPNGLYMVYRPDNNSHMFLNPGQDIISFDNYDLFMEEPRGLALVSVLDLPEPEGMTTMDKVNLTLSRLEAGEAISPEEIQALAQAQEQPSNTLFALLDKPFNRAGKPVKMTLGEYGIDIAEKDGECYVPFQTLVDIFAPPFYVYWIFNTETVICCDRENPLLDRVYEAEARDVSQAMASFNFSELCFNLDTFYGLKDEHGIDTFLNLFLLNPGLMDQLTSTNSRDVDAAMAKLTTTYLDDGHSSFNKSSWYGGKMQGGELLLTLGNLGPSTRQRASISKYLTTARQAVYGDTVPQYEEVGDTAFITFDKFEMKRKKVEDYYNIEDPDNPQDTIELMIYANRQVRRENSPVKNIVMDLSLNGGGESTAALFVIAWFTGRAYIDLRAPLSGAETVSYYMADVNLNGLFQNDKGDTVAGGDYNLYCLTSQQSFSCGNLVPACFKESGVVTLIGRRTGGGSNVVRPCTTAIGSVFQISGNKQLTTISNGSFYNIDRGIEPDIVLTRYTSYYDRQGLADLINSTK